MVQPVSRLTGGKVGVPVNSVVPLNVNSVNFFTSVTGDEYLRTGVTDSNITNYPDATPSYSVSNNTIHTFDNVEIGVVKGACFNEITNQYMIMSLSPKIVTSVDNDGTPNSGGSFILGLDIANNSGLAHDPSTDKYYVGDSSNGKVIEFENNGVSSGVVIDTSNETLVIRDIEIVGDYLLVAGIDPSTSDDRIFVYDKTSSWSFNNWFGGFGSGIPFAMTRLNSTTVGLRTSTDTALRQITVPSGVFVSFIFSGISPAGETPLQEVAYDPINDDAIFITDPDRILYAPDSGSSEFTLNDFSPVYSNLNPLTEAKWIDALDEYMVLFNENNPIRFYDNTFTLTSSKPSSNLPSGTNSIDYDGTAYYWCTHGTSVTRLDADFAPDTHTIDLAVSLSSVACVGSIIYASGANDRTIYTVDSSGNKLPEEYDLSQYIQGDITDIYFDGSYLWVLDSTNGQALKITIGGVSTGIQVSTGASSEYKILKITETTAEFMRSGQGIANEYSASVGISDAKFDSDSGLPLYLRVK